MSLSLPVLRRLALLLALSLAMGGVASAAAPMTRIRATIERVDGPVLTLTTREGESVKVTLTPDAKVTAMIPAGLGDIGVGSFVGTAAVPQSDGKLKAQEVVIFPEAMRGVGEGHRGWDLTPDSTMTNATVEAAVTDTAGPVLTLAYKDGKQELVVPQGTPIVTLIPGDPSLLKAGNHVFLGATEGADGGLTAARITVGKDGLMPPM